MLGFNISFGWRCAFNFETVSKSLGTGSVCTDLLTYSLHKVGLIQLCQCGGEVVAEEASFLTAEADAVAGASFFAAEADADTLFFVAAEVGLVTLALVGAFGIFKGLITFGVFEAASFCFATLATCFRTTRAGRIKEMLVDSCSSL